MDKIHLLEDDDSEDEEGRVSKRKDREMLDVFLTNIVQQKVLQVMEQNIVPMISKIVEQVLESAIQKYLTSWKQNSGSGIHYLESKNFRLKFLDKISVPVFTGTHIKGQEGTLKVALVDDITDQVIKTGPEASAKVKIVVVEGDFDVDKRSNWTRDEFNTKIVQEMGGKKSLLTGQVYLDLKEGIGFVGEISFTHNANWMKCAEYRLGAVVEYLSQNRIREAITESIVVKDRRMKLYRKNYPPSQFDEVWRLEKIGKDGPFHKSLDKENIKTVKDFLTQYNKNPQWLREILGPALTAKMWEAIVDHARTCILDKKLHLYFPLGSLKEGVVFNVVGQVMGLILECCFVPIDQLSEAQKADAHKLVIYALEHMEEVLPFDNETSMNNSLQSFKASLTGYEHDHSQPSTSAHNNELVPLDDETSMHASLQFWKASLTGYVHDHAQPSTSAHNNEELVPLLSWKASLTGYGHDHAQPSAFAVNEEELVPSQSGKASLTGYVHDHAKPSASAHNNEELAPLQSWKTSLTGYGHDHAQPSTSAVNEGELVPLQSWKASLTGYGHDHAQPSTAARNNELVRFDDEYPYSSNFETCHINNEYVQPSSDPLGIGSFLPSFGTVTDLNGYGFPLLPGYPLIPPETFFNASFCKEHLQFRDTDNSHECQSSNLESWGGDLIDVVNGNPLARAAKRRWTKLFSVLQWYSIRKSVALKSVSSARIHSPKRARIY